MDKHALTQAAYCTAVIWAQIFNFIPAWLWAMIGAVYGTNILFWMVWAWVKLLMDSFDIPLSYRPITNRLLLLNLIVPFRLFWRP